MQWYHQAENEKNHKVRMGVGNGLRQDVWREFHSRFGEICMCELYGSTEGNLCFMNHVGKIGAVGRSNFFYKVSVNFFQFNICSVIHAYFNIDVVLTTGL